jgi:transcription elongation factor
MQKNRERQMKMAGQVGVVNDVDPDDKIVRVKVNNSNAWFTLDMLSFENSVTTTATVAS